MPKSSSLKKHVQAIGETLRQLEGQVLGLVPVFAQATKATVAQAVAATPPRRKLKLSPERRRALKLQGQYLGNMRQLKPAQKARVKAVKAKNGMRAAIAMARKLAGA
jgi:predicted membrane metal-binding protein